MLSPEVVDCLDRAVLCWLATADESGAPSVSPKEIFVVRSPQELLIADIASPRSVRNVSERASVCVAAIDVFEQRGYQVYGTARVVGSDDAEFAELSAPLLVLAGPRFPIRSVISVRVDRVAPIVAPSLWMYPDASASERRASVLAAYGVSEPVREL